MKNIKLDLTKLLGFKIVASEKKVQHAVVLKAKLGVKAGPKKTK
jgi:hypothetical protein